MGILSRKSWSEVKLEQADKKAKTLADGSLVLVEVYHTPHGLANDTRRMLEDGWTLAAQVPQRKKTIVTWTKPPA